MAIVNATPDSFSGDGVGGDVGAALQKAEIAGREGADFIDIGGESTRPRHIPLSTNDELARVIPIVRAVAARLPLRLSIDTSKAAVAEAAIQAGASIINDVRGFCADPEMAGVAAATGVGVVLMHDLEPEPGADLLTSIAGELSRRVDRALAAGVDQSRIVVDPGFGFGKDWRQNLELLRRLGELQSLGLPILVGFSRKSTIGRVLGLPEGDRLEGTLATTALAIANGADIVRVHDVRANVRASRMTDAVVRDAPVAPLTWTTPGETG